MANYLIVVICYALAVMPGCKSSDSSSTVKDLHNYGSWAERVKDPDTKFAISQVQRYAESVIDFNKLPLVAVDPQTRSKRNVKYSENLKEILAGKNEKLFIGDENQEFHYSLSPEPAELDSNQIIINITKHSAKERDVEEVIDYAVFKFDIKESTQIQVRDELIGQSHKLQQIFDEKTYERLAKSMKSTSENGLNLRKEPTLGAKVAFSLSIVSCVIGLGLFYAAVQIAGSATGVAAERGHTLFMIAGLFMVAMVLLMGLGAGLMGYGGGNSNRNGTFDYREYKTYRHYHRRMGGQSLP